MWPFKKKVRVRRADALRAGAGGESPPWSRFRAAGGPGALAIGMAFYLAVTAMDVWPVDPLPYRLGQYVPRDITPRWDFRALDEKALAQAEGDARDGARAVFRVNIALVEEIVATLGALPARLGATTQPAQLDPEVRKRFSLGSVEALAAWRPYARPEEKQALERQLQALREQLLGVYLVRPAERGASAKYVDLVVGEQRTASDWSELISLADTQRVTDRVSRAMAASLAEPIRAGARAYLLGVFGAGRPLYRYDAAATDEVIRAAVDAVRRAPPPECYRHFKAADARPQGIDILVRRSRRRAPDGGERIVPLGEEDLELLRKEHQAYLAATGTRTPWARWVRAGGRAGVLLVVTVLLGGYIAYFEPRVVRNRWRAAAIAGGMLLMLAITKTMSQLTSQLGTNPHVVALPVVMACLVVTIVYDQRFALALGAALAIYVVLQIRQDLAMLVVLMTAVGATVGQLREVRTRSKLILVSAVAACAVFACIWAEALARGIPWRFARDDSLWGAGAALLGGFLIQGILPVIERVFGIATSMTLLEWCDASKPLLQRLRTEAPGTYNHSLQLGSICEAAAEGIGARPLLARVGAYYHDIGKINKAEYFVENLAGAANKHEKLSPAMSLLIITGHVKDGLEIARKYSLPRELYEFISTHHGTTLVQYFYHAATERRRADTERAPDEVEFRYPGPKPRGREAAILMLADAAESSVRAMPEPLPGRIENQVHAVIQGRLADGQLDACDLTLQQVHRIETSIVKSLCAMYHPRIAYPTPAGQPLAAGERPDPRVARNGHNGRSAPSAGP